MKNTILLVAMLLSFSNAYASGGTVYTIAYPATGGTAQIISVPSDSYLTVVAFVHASSSLHTSSRLSLEKNGVSVTLGSSVPSGYTTASSATSNITGIKIAGPATITYTGDLSGGDVGSVLSYTITANSQVEAIQTPSNAVVIPANAGGAVSIILESSTDLITWTAANPGTYDTSIQKRFFRVRAISN